MSGTKRDRQRNSRQARAAAAEAARRRAARMRWILGGSAAAVVIGIILVVTVFASPGDDGTDVESTSPTTSADRSPAEGSAAGKPCVPLADPLPPGAPHVPVKEGPPPTELVTEDLKVGDGPEVTKGATVTVQYIGVSCSTGKIFDTSYAGGEPATFPLGQVIPGWQNGIPGMKVGGQRLLGIPPADAYGARGQPPDIAPDETLWFVVEVQEAKSG